MFSDAPDTDMDQALLSAPRRSPLWLTPIDLSMDELLLVNATSIMGIQLIFVYNIFESPVCQGVL